MKRFLTVAVVAALMAFCTSANAGQIWTDGNGDGLPDGGAFPAAPSTNVTVGVWMDAQSFNWTNFLAYVEWNNGCFTYVSASYVIAGGSNFPVDNFSHPRGIGFGGSGYNRSGVDLVGNITLHLDGAAGCCVTPIIDVYNPYYVFSSLGNAPAGTYQLFTTNPGSCYGVPVQTGACCFPDGSCAVLTSDQCAAQGGNYAGDGVSCAQANCPPPPQFEACCFPDGSCVDAPLGGCPAGSTPQGAGTSCATVTCPDTRPREACCFPDGSCVEAIAGQCPSGSAPQGAGTDCDPNECPQPPVLGACCRVDGSCTDGVPSTACSAPGETWFPNTPCSQVNCLNAVESKSWGNIKGLYR